MHELIEMETAGWRALSTDPESARRFYEEVLDGNVVMLLPGGLRLEGPGAAVEAMSGPPWSTFELSDVDVVDLHDDAAIVVYAVTAQREGAEPYTALTSSAYVRRSSGWKLILHQQTPR